MSSPRWLPKLMILLRRLTDGHHETRDHVRTLHRRVDTIEKAMPRERLKGVYRGVWEKGCTYEAGDFVTRSGSLWYAHEDTAEKPGAGVTAWQLAVKRGEAEALNGGAE